MIKKTALILNQLCKNSRAEENENNVNLIKLLQLIEKFYLKSQYCYVNSLSNSLSDTPSDSSERKWKYGRIKAIILIFVYKTLVK